MSANTQVEKEMANVAKQFIEQPHMRLLGSDAWVFPIQLAEIQMKTVVRSQMDVLMKMILKIVKKLDVKQAQEISELLAVETIFVEHMLDLLKQNKMVEKKEELYQLTTVGTEHLNKGTFVHDPTDEQIDLFYSPYHQEVLTHDYEQQMIEDTDDLAEYRIEQETKQKDVTSLEDDQMTQMILDSGYEVLVDDGQKQIDEITSIHVKETVPAVCFEFHLHDTIEDLVSIRIWNTWTGSFDVAFETELNQKEASRLRKQYFEQNPK
jgi:hypothetical protein